MSCFTREKFLKQPLPRQHKKLSQTLSRLYFSLVNAKESENTALIFEIKEWMLWMDLAPFQCWEDKKAISDLYHTHLRLAGMSQKEHNLLPQVQKGDRESPLAAPLSGANVYLDNLRSAHNVGSILRCCEAFALDTVYFSPSTPFSDHEKVQKTAMGCATQCKTKVCESIQELPGKLIAVETSADSVDLYDFIFPETYTLALGNEEYGLSDETLANADYLLRIPLYGRKNSLNVSCAFSVLASWARHCHIINTLNPIKVAL